MSPVFVSASIPDPRRDARYHSTADVVAIREAVRALAAVVIRRAPLVFGGHPAITPLIRHVAERVGHADRIVIYQSEYFRAFFPEDNCFFRNMVVVPEVRGDREASLLQMRTTMFRGHDFAAGVFIGGMEGVEQEFDLFRQCCPRARWFPVGTGGAAARIVLDAHKTELPAAQYAALAKDLVYGPMFERLLGYTQT